MATSNRTGTVPSTLGEKPKTVDPGDRLKLKLLLATTTMAFLTALKWLNVSGCLPTWEHFSFTLLYLFGQLTMVDKNVEALMSDLQFSRQFGGIVTLTAPMTVEPCRYYNVKGPLTL